jgi:hypothetical protein
MRTWARRHWMRLGFPGDLDLLLTRLIEDPAQGLLLQEEVYRIALREERTMMIPALEQRLKKKPRLTGRNAADDPRKHLAELRMIEVDQAAGESGADSDAWLTGLLDMAREDDAESRNTAIVKLTGNSSRVKAQADRWKVAAVLVRVARDLTWSNVGTATMQSALLAYQDAIPLADALALSRADRLGYDGKAVPRALAAALLAEYPEPAAKERLEEMLKDECRLVQIIATRSLGR